MPHRLEMHQVRAAADLDVALVGRGGERVEQPACVGIGDKPVPGAADDRDRGAHRARIVGKIAMPGGENVGEWTGRDLDAGRIASSRRGVAVEIALAPIHEVRVAEYRRLARRHVLDEARPLIGEGDKAPRWGRRRLLVATCRPPRDRTKQDHAVHQHRAACRKTAGRHGTPGVSDQREARHVVLRQNEAHGGLELFACICRAAKRRVRLGGRGHLRIAVGGAEPEEIEAPDVEPGLDKRIAPGKSVKPMRDRQC